MSNLFSVPTSPGKTPDEKEESKQEVKNRIQRQWRIVTYLVSQTSLETSWRNKTLLEASWRFWAVKHYRGQAAEIRCPTVQNCSNLCGTCSTTREAEETGSHKQDRKGEGLHVDPKISSENQFSQAIGGGGGFPNMDAVKSGQPLPDWEG